MTDEPVCDLPGCGKPGTITSRLSPEGYLVATGKKAYSSEKPTGSSAIARLPRRIDERRVVACPQT